MRYKTKNDDGEDVERYGLRAGYAQFVPCMDLTPTTRIAELLLEERKAAIHARDELLAIQKELGQAGEREGAKIVKGLVQEQMRRYRAVCFHIPWFVCDPPGDCKKVVPPELWPLELEAELDAVGRIIVATIWEPAERARQRGRRREDMGKPDIARTASDIAQLHTTRSKDDER